jgi:catechol O-methyltransferase
VHTAVVLFTDMPDLAHAFLEVFKNSTSSGHVITPPRRCYGYYWIGHDLVTLMIIPFLELVLGYATWQSSKKEMKKFWNHLLYWNEGTFAAWDPLPFWVLYHVYWPVRFVQCLLYGHHWSRYVTPSLYKCGVMSNLYLESMLARPKCSNAR